MNSIALVCASELPLPAVLGGGAETLMMNLINENEVAKELKIDVYSYNNNEASVLADNYSSTEFHFYHANSLKNAIDVVYRIWRRITLRKSQFRSCFLNEICKSIKNSEAEVVVIAGNQMYVDYIYQKTKKPVVLHMHTDLLNNDTPNSKRIVEKCKGIITISDYCKQRVCAIDKEALFKTKTLKNTIDTSLFSKEIDIERSVVRQKWGINNNYPLLLFCGRLDEGKGSLQLLQALESIDKEVKFNLLVVGGALYSSNKETEYIKKLKEISHTISNIVVFTGHLDNSMLPEIYASSDLTIFPSLCNEAAGLITIESLAMGTPVITTEKGGIPEYANHDACVIIPVGSDFVERLANEIFKFLTEVNYRNALKKKASEYILTYTQKEYYDKFVSILRSFV